MRKPGWAFVGGGNIASPKVIPEYYAPNEDVSVSQRTKRKNAEGRSWSSANSSSTQLALGHEPSVYILLALAFPRMAGTGSPVSGNTPSRQLGE